MSEVSFLGISTHLNALQVAVLVIATFYVGIYLLISNHFVFKPKMQEYFLNNQIQSKALYQFIIDFLTNLSLLTFILCTVLIGQSDSSLRIMIFSDISWSGLCVGIISFKCLKISQERHWQLFLKKNALLLCIIYLTTWVHYFLGLNIISLGIVFLAIYLINLIADSNEEKFVKSMEMLFGYKGDDIEIHAYKQQINMISPEILAKKFPVKEKQIMAKMKIYDKEFKDLKIKTRLVVTENLMKIALAIQMSKQKMQAKQKRDVRNYFGTFNGTILQKSKRLIVDRKTTVCMKHFQEEEDEQATENSNQHFNSFIFYLFPVKIFQTNKLMSILFSIILNFGFGFLLSITMTLTSHYTYSKYIEFLYALLLIPLIPTNISKEQFFISMSLSSLWKYCLYGLALIISTLLDGQLKINEYIIYLVSTQFLSIIIIAYFILMGKLVKFKIIFVWIFLIGINQIMIFKYA